MTASRRTRRSATFFVLACVAVWLVPTAIAIGLWSATEFVEKESVSAETPEFIEVGQRLDSEARDAVVDVHLGDARIVTSGSTGTVTQVFTSVGAALSNGEPVLAVNDSVVLAYAQDFPLYRPLARGSHGADVEALQRFLRDCGILDVAVIDSDYGPQVERAVRDFQRRYGHDVDGVFQPSYVAFVGSSFTVAHLDIVAGGKLAVDDEIMKGAAPVTRVEITDPELKPLPPFSDAPLLLEIVGTSFSIEATTLDSAAAQDLADGLGSAGVIGTMLEDAQLLRYANARVSLQEPGTWGTLPSSAVFVTAEGRYCSLDANRTLVRLEDPRESTGQPGIVLVQPDLVGTTVLSNVADVDPKLFEQCA